VGRQAHFPVQEGSMTYAVKFMDCVEVCPVDCFMRAKLLVIH
jgi:hypothetical protein